MECGRWEWSEISSEISSERGAKGWRRPNNNNEKSMAPETSSVVASLLRFVIFVAVFRFQGFVGGVEHSPRYGVLQRFFA